MPKKILAVIIILALVVGMQVVKQADANPYTPNKAYPDTPDLNPPNIIIQLPENNITYASGIIPYALIIQEPSFWINSTAHGRIASVDCIIDGKDVKTIFKTYYPISFAPIINLNGTISGVNDGKHSISFLVNCERFYYNQKMPKTGLWWDAAPLIYNLYTNSSKLYVSVDTSLPAISNLSIDNKTRCSSDVPVIAVVIAIALAGAGLLVYFRRRRGSHNEKIFRI